MAKKKFQDNPTHIPWVNLRIKSGKEVDMPVKIIDGLYEQAKKYAGAKWQIDRLTREQAELKKKIVPIAEGYDGFRGISSEEENFLLNIIPSEKVKYAQELLKESLGIAYSAIVHEELEVKISIPLSIISEEKLAGAILDALEEIGIPKEEANKIMSIETNLAVDEKKLDEMARTKKVELLPGAKEFKITWALRVDKLDKDRLSII